MFKTFLSKLMSLFLPRKDVLMFYNTVNYGDPETPIPWAQNQVEIRLSLTGGVTFTFWDAHDSIMHLDKRNAMSLYYFLMDDYSGEEWAMREKGMTLRVRKPAYKRDGFLMIEDGHCSVIPMGHTKFKELRELLKRVR